MKTKIQKIYRSDKDKNGNPLKTKDDRPYTRIAIQTAEYGSKWLSGFENRANFDWKEEDVVEIEIEKVLVNGKEYLNFKNLSQIQLLWRAINEIKADIEAIKTGNHEESPVDEFEPPKEDLPF